MLLSLRFDGRVLAWPAGWKCAPSMGPRPDVHAVEKPEVAVAHRLERPKQSQARGYADPRKHLLDEAGCPEFIVLRTNFFFFYIVGHQPTHTKGQRQRFQAPNHISLFLASWINASAGRSRFR